MLAFIDVSGDPYSAPQHSPWIVAHAFCVQKRYIYDITANLHRLKKDILGKEFIEMKSTALINPSTLNHSDLDKTMFLQKVVDNCMDQFECRHASMNF